MSLSLNQFLNSICDCSEMLQVQFHDVLNSFPER